MILGAMVKALNILAIKKVKVSMQQRLHIIF